MATKEVNQHKRMAMGAKINGQNFKKGGAVPCAMDNTMPMKGAMPPAKKGKK